MEVIRLAFSVLPLLPLSSSSSFLLLLLIQSSSFFPLLIFFLSVLTSFSALSCVPFYSSILPTLLLILSLFSSLLFAFFPSITPTYLLLCPSSRCSHSAHNPSVGIFCRPAPLPFPVLSFFHPSLVYHEPLPTPACWIIQGSAFYRAIQRSLCSFDSSSFASPHSLMFADDVIGPALGTDLPSKRRFLQSISISDNAFPFNYHRSVPCAL